MLYLPYLRAPTCRNNGVAENESTARRGCWCFRSHEIASGFPLNDRDFERSASKKGNGKVHGKFSLTIAAFVTVVVASVPLLGAAAAVQEELPGVAPHELLPSKRPQPSALDESTPVEMERPTTWGEPTEVKVSMFVIDVDEVDSAQQSFAASVYYEARWRSPFLVHEGPGPLHRRITEVWNPQLIIVNQQMAWYAFPEAVHIYPDGEVHYRQKVWARFSQPLELRDFPMDRQTLSIHLVAASVLEEEVRIVPIQLEDGTTTGIASQLSLPDWDVLSWNAEPTPYVAFEGEAGVPGFRMQIEVERRLPYWVMKVIFPLCLIVFMSWAPFWIDPEQVGTNIAIATTSFLTLVAYRFAIGVLVPHVSYITRMDRFILLSTLMVFASLVQTVANTRLVKKGKTELVRRMDSWSRVVYAVVLAVIVVVAFVL